MPFKDKEKKRQYDKEYSQSWYIKNRKKKLEYQQSRREQNLEAWRRWNKKQQDKKRKAVLRGGFVYQSKKPYSNK